MRMKLAELMCDRLDQMGLAQADLAVDEQRIVGLGGRFGNGQSGRAGGGETGL